MRNIKLLTLLAAMVCAISMRAVTIVNNKLPGAFSISATQVVYFSQGNLQYQASTNTWRFATNQYDYVGDASNGNVYENSVKCSNTNISSSYSGWIDLFGWATSGNSASGTYYQPYENYTGNQYGSSTTSGEWDPEKSDWGVVNAHQLGFGWHTLSKDDWDYIISSRTNAQSLRGMCQITIGSSTFPGLILMPDGWTASTSTIATKWSACAISAENVAFDKATFSEEEWNIMENQGAVFLPAGGQRSRNIMSYLDPRAGKYWTSTGTINDYNELWAYYLMFYRGPATSTLKTTSYYRSYGLSVRLARYPDATLNSAPTAKSLTYNGSAQALVNVGSATNGTMNYSLDNRTWSSSIPTATNAGTYTVYFKVKADATHADYAPMPNTNKVEVTIAKATPTVTAPTGKSLTYNGEAQELVNTGTTSGGTMMYKVNDEAWSEDVPTATNAGNYTVYYKVVGDENYADYTPASNTSPFGLQ